MIFFFSFCKDVFCTEFNLAFQANHTQNTVKASDIIAVGSSTNALLKPSTLQ